MPACQAFKDDGSPCKFSAPVDHEYCRNHDPNISEEERREAAARAGRASGVARQPLPVQAVDLDFSTRAGVQAALEVITRMELLGRITPVRSRNILRALTLAHRNFDKARFVPGTGERFLHNQREYRDSRQALIRNIAHIAEEAAARDAEQAPSPPSNSRRSPSNQLPDPMPILNTILKQARRR